MSHVNGELEKKVKNEIDFVYENFYSYTKNFRKPSGLYLNQKL